MENPTLPIGKPSRTIRGKMRNVDRAYIAGFFDGEGSLGIYFVRSRDGKTGVRNDNWNPAFFIRASLGNTDISIPKFLKEWYGGSLLQENRNKRLPRSQNVWRWSATGKIAHQFLRDTIAYLFQKKEKAKILIDFYQKSNILSFEEKNEIRNKIISLNGFSGKSHHPQRLNEKTPVLSHRVDITNKTQVN